MDTEPSDPWNEMVILFNGKLFKTKLFPSNINGAIPHHISAVDASVFISDHTPDIWKTKWGKLKSNCGTSVEHFKQSEQKDPGSFPNFV